MKILALDTSEEHCTVALRVGGETLSLEQYAPRRHTELILPMLEQLLAEAAVRLDEVDALAFGRGPGSFTGVRIATGVAQGIALGRDLPLVPVSTLQALALHAHLQTGHGQLLAALDARMSEVYWAAYQVAGPSEVNLLGPERVLAPAPVPVPEGVGWFGCGSGWGAYGELLQQRIGPRLLGMDTALGCRAREIALLAEARVIAGDTVLPEEAMPVYLRDQVAWKKMA